MDVFPWSTCPRTVTMGGLVFSLVGSSLAREKSSSREVVTTAPSPSVDSTATTSSLATGSTVKPNSSATISAVAKSMTWLMFARILEAMSFLMTSTAVTPSLSARSLTDSEGGRTTRRSPLVSILGVTAVGLKAVRAASIAPGARGAAVLRVSLRCWRKLTSSFWLMPSSRASSCAFISELLIMPGPANSKLRRVPHSPSGTGLGRGALSLYRGERRPDLLRHRHPERALQCPALPGGLQAVARGVNVGAAAGQAAVAVDLDCALRTADDADQ